MRDVDIAPNAGRVAKKCPVVPQRFRWTDPWLVAEGPGLRRLVQKVLRFLQFHEEHTGQRRRRRRATAEAQFRAQVEFLVCNLAYAAIVPPKSGRLAVLLGHRSRTRYDGPAFGETLSQVMNLFWETQMIDTWRRSTSRQEATSFAPTEWFKRRVNEAGVTLEEFGRHPDEALIVLKVRKRGGREAFVDFPTDAAVKALEAEVRAVNVQLRSADIEFVDDGIFCPINTLERNLRRHFNTAKAGTIAFNEGGRLFGGFWQAMPSSRRSSIRINGEPCATLDFRSMFTRLAYAELGAQPPDGDLYWVPELAGYRSGIKLAMNCFLFDTNPRRSGWPVQMGIDDDVSEQDVPEQVAQDFDGLLPSGWGVARTKRAILSQHPILRGAWGRGLGHRLMFLESEILMRVLSDLKALNVVALPLHDAVLVPWSAAPVTKEIMEQASAAVCGVRIPVSVKLGGH